MQSEEFYTLKEVQSILKMSRSGIISWIKSGKLPAVKINNGRKWYVKKSELEKVLNGTDR
jgi:excisionase family DNA binding protein